MGPITPIQAMGWGYRAVWVSYRLWGGDIGLHDAHSPPYKLWGMDIGLHGVHIPHRGYGVGI